MKRSKASRLHEPAMSDQMLLVSVEDLINIAMGPSNKNVVNYKMVQTILMILARQLRLLEQRVEIRITERSPSPSDEESPPRVAKKEKSKSRERKISRDRTKTDASKARMKEERAAAKELERLERNKDKAERGASKEREREERHAAKDKEKSEREQDKEDRRAAKDKEKAEREQDKEDRRAAKDKEKAEKEREREEKHAAKDRDKADRGASKEREREDRRAARDQEKAEKERDREDKHASKDREKRDRAASKEREKEDKQAAKEKGKAEKERDREDRHAAKDRDKADRGASKEREREDRHAAKDKEKSEKEREREDRQAGKDKEKAEKERERDERHTTKDKEKMEREKLKADRGTSKEREQGREKEPSKTVSATSITISEKKGKGKDKVLVVEKGPSTRADSRTRGGSIEVVTVSQFEMLEQAVQELSQKAAPLPMPSMPDNKKLRSDLARGSASLTDTMQAMQVTARVQAAEEAITRMADLLTQLAACGALPEDVAGQVAADLQETLAAAAAARAPPRPTARSTIKQSVASRKSVAIEPGALKSSMGRPSTATRPSTVSAASARASSVGRPSVVSTAGSLGQPSMSMQSSTGAKVTRSDMEDELRNLKEQLTKTVQNLTMKASSAVETAGYTIKGIIDKMDIAMKIDSRVDKLYSLVSDYSEQLSGFDTGMVTQMQSFQEQIAMMRGDLKGGLTLLESANNNAETAAVMELTERYTGLATELDQTVLAHQGLATLQGQLEEQLKNLIESVEVLREQKADRDEVADGLRDKADMTRLSGLLRDEDFVGVRQELERRLELCYEKFQKQDIVWMTALKDLTNISEEKAEILQLLSLKDNTQQDIRDLHKNLRVLAQILGEPKAAMLTRKLARDATCGACRATALMDPTERTFGAPPPLPRAAAPPRPDPAGREEPCLGELTLPMPSEEKAHMCKRWVGGSHTMLREGVSRVAAPPVQLHGAPTKRYIGYGDDGEIYLMEDELQPCVECNQVWADEGAKEGGQQTPKPAQDGAGDQGRKSRVIFEEPKLN